MSISQILSVQDGGIIWNMGHIKMTKTSPLISGAEITSVRLPYIFLAWKITEGIQSKAVIMIYRNIQQNLRELLFSHEDRTYSTDPI